MEQKDTFDVRSEPSTQGKANAMWSAYHALHGLTVSYIQAAK